MPERHAGVVALRGGERGARLAACAPAFLAAHPGCTPRCASSATSAATVPVAPPAPVIPAVPVGGDSIPDPRARPIADAIIRWLTSGVHLDAPARTFLEAQLGVTGLAGLPATDVAARLAPLLGAGPEGQASPGIPGAIASSDIPHAPDIPDAEGALEYLLYPDTALRLSVEPLLAQEAGEAVSGASDPGAPSTRLADAVLAVLPPDAMVVLHVSEVPEVSGQSGALPTPPYPGQAPHAAHALNTSGTLGPVSMPGSVRFTLPVPRWTMALLVRRLRLDRVIPAPLAAAVAEHLPEQQGLAVRLALRDARFDLADAAPAPCDDAAGSSSGPACETRSDLVLRFIRRMPPSDPGYVETLALWLDLLHDLPPGRSAHAALAARRERLSRAAREADEFTERLGRLNMEILMLQGVHAPALDAAEARRKVRLMDRMCLAVLGRPAALDPAEEGMAPKAPDGHDLGAFDPATGLDDLMRLLS